MQCDAQQKSLPCLEPVEARQACKPRQKPLLPLKSQKFVSRFALPTPVHTTIACDHCTMPLIKLLRGLQVT